MPHGWTDRGFSPIHRPDLLCYPVKNMDQVKDFWVTETHTDRWTDREQMSSDAPCFSWRVCVWGCGLPGGWGGQYTIPVWRADTSGWGPPWACFLWSWPIPFPPSRPWHLCDTSVRPCIHVNMNMNMKCKLNKHTESIAKSNAGPHHPP